jgi:hypothetical protein
MGVLIDEGDMNWGVRGSSGETAMPWDASAILMAAEKSQKINRGEIKKSSGGELGFGHVEQTAGDWGRIRDGVRTSLRLLFAKARFASGTRNKVVICPDA